MKQIDHFDISGFLSSSTSVSPHLSPSADSKAGVDSIDANQELQQVRLSFAAKPNEVTIVIFQLNPAINFP